MSTGYILNTDINTQNRLDLQHRLYQQSSVNLLLKAGVSKGQKGLDVGCGTGKMPVEISNLIGNTGKLIAIDVSNEQVEPARKFASNCSNINFQIVDINTLDDFSNQFDFIYCRMVLHHLDGTYCYPASSDYEQYVELVKQCFIKNNKDYQIAVRSRILLPSYISEVQSRLLR